MISLVFTALLFADPVAQDLASIPSPYYLNQPYPDRTIWDLPKTIGKGIPAAYQKDVFDCSNMASYLQWKLQSQGFDAKICLSKHFRGGGGPAWMAVDSRGNVCHIDPTRHLEERAHAWVAVDIQGIRYYIDPVDSMVPKLPGSVDYREYDAFEQIYSSIYDLVQEHPLVDFVWWNRGQLNYSAEAKLLEARP